MPGATPSRCIASDCSAILLCLLTATTASQALAAAESPPSQVVEQTAPQVAAANEKLPPNQSLIGVGVAHLHLTGQAAGDVKSRPITVDDAPGFTQALHVETARRAPNEYDAQFVLPVQNVTLHKGDVVWASVRVRMLQTADESGQGVFGLVLEQDKEPFNKLIQRRVSVGRSWQQLAAPARLSADYPAGSLHLALRVGGAAQTLEFGDVQLVTFDDPKSITLAQLPQTRITYGGRDPHAAWRAAADARIERVRKAPLTVRVTDAQGRPVSGAAVTVEMKQHAFPFGCEYNPQQVVGPDALTPAGKEFLRRYVDLFNVGTDEYAMKWPGWDDPATRTTALAALDWMTAHGVRVRGHCLVWPAWRHLPADVKKLQDDPKQLADRIDQHITDEVTALKGRVFEWDVVNEPYVNHDLMNILGYGAMADWFKLAHAADSNPRLLLNETSVPTNPPADPHYNVLFDQVKAIQKAGAPIGGVGMQAHFGSELTSMADLQQIFARFAKLGIPTEITEFDVDTNDQQLQADYLRDFMTLSFSEPSVSGFIMWGFAEGHHWRPDAALWRADWTIKPAGQAWLDLVKKKWWTHATLSSGPNGSAEVRGFLGDYTITATDRQKSTTVTARLPHGGTTVDVVLK